MFSKIHEECGVFGIYSETNDVASACYYGMYALQHRGQESCGIVVNDEGKFKNYKNTGLVDEVFTQEKLRGLGCGQMAISHVRYGTTGTDPLRNVQPLVVNQLNDTLALAHNGNLTNAYQLRDDLERKGSIFHTTSDTEVIAYIITQERLATDSIEHAISRAMKRLTGAYSLLIMTQTQLIAVRDPMGFRPLCLGRTVDGGYVVASESCALDSIGAVFMRDVEPGEIVIIDKEGIRSNRDNVSDGRKALCVFEFIYFARPDSVIDGSSVHVARMRGGSFLALEHPVQADVVIGVPDSGIDAAIGYSKQSGIPYDIGFIKNKYIGRTFIEPGQSYRQDRVRIKLNAVSAAVKGKRVVMIDDSIVRGNTSRPVVKRLREAGAAEVHMRVTAPPYINPCYYGTDIDSKDALIACRHTVDEIAEIIGVDSLGYLSVASALKLADATSMGFCDACFTGNYPCGVPGDNCKGCLELAREEKL